ncbi:unnamed protein product [Urochloa decumbens]|uniref:F-box domain-containing protein n=1 Tax=Urochloa decumbens TaxID=240449 RepID=A0ABC8WNH0_9POAL
MAQIPPGPGARAPPSLPSHLIEEILVRIATPRDLARASAACATFRRLVADASFLRRYRSLHPPLLLGLIDRPFSFTAAEAPHPNAPAAAALARAADFSFECLGPRGLLGWFHCDARDGRVLLMCPSPPGGPLFPELAVCDPLTRRHTLLPPIPNRLVPSSVCVPAWEELVDCFHAFFVPSGDYEDTQFRYMWSYPSLLWVPTIHVTEADMTFQGSDLALGFSWAIYGPTAGLLLLPEFAVWDPLTRGHTLLPSIPNRLVVPSVRIPPWDQLISCFDAFFVPSGDYEQTQFRVICWAHWVASVFVYSSLSGTWTAGPTANWDALGLNVYPEEGMPWLSSSPSYAYGCFYWKVFTSNKLLKLEVNRMEFSAVSLPPNHENQQFVVVEEAGEGKIGIFSHISGQEIPESLCYSIRQDEGENANEHVMETTIPLPTDHDNYRVVAAGEGYIFLLGSRSISQQGTVVLRGGRLAFFTLEIKTLKIERVCSIRGGLCGHILPYFGFPPFMSPRRI